MMVLPDCTIRLASGTTAAEVSSEEGSAASKMAATRQIISRSAGDVCSNTCLMAACSRHESLDRMPLCGQAKRDGMTEPSVPNHMFLHLIKKASTTVASHLMATS
jgi:hypothetical protein